MTQPIPRPPGVPILGNIFDVDPSNTWISLKRLSEEHGEIFQIKVLRQTLVFVARVALSEELCDEKRFRKYVGGPVVEIRAAIHDALFTAYEEEKSWGIAHRIIAPQLQPDALSGERFDQMRDTTLELMDIWKRSTGPVDPFKDLNRLDLEAVTLTMYGKKLNCLEGPEHPMIRAMDESTSEAVKRPTRPGILNWLLYRGKFRTSIKAMRDYAADVVKYRKEHPTDRKDLLWALMNSKDPETDEALTDSQVIDEIVSMLIGSSTAPCLVATTILFLQNNPETVVKARKELDAIVGADQLTCAHLSQLKYVKGIMRESLRLSFVAPGFNIEPLPSADKSPVQLGGGKYQVAYNQPMLVIMAGVNRDPAVFEEPLAFRPERMMGDAFAQLPAGAKKWFGNGKRECIGKYHAWQWTMTVLATMLHEVDFELLDATTSCSRTAGLMCGPSAFTSGSRLGLRLSR